LIALVPMTRAVHEQVNQYIASKKDAPAPKGQSSSLWFQRGPTLYRLGSYKDALKQLGDPETPEGKLFFAMSQLRLGNKAQARDLLAKVVLEIERKPPADWVERLRLIVLRAEADELIAGKNR